MKKVFILAVLMGSMITSCKKPAQIQPNSANQNYTQLESNQIVPTIKDFEEKVKSATSDDATEIGRDNAIWLAEAAVNFDYDYADNIYDQNTYSTKLNWNFEGEAITKKSAADLYITTKEVIDNYLLKNSNHKIKLIDIEYNHDFIITIVGGSIAENSKLPMVCQPFGSTDYWNVWSGKCDAYSGQGNTSGAPQELTKKLNAKCVTEICNNGGNIVYTNISSTIILGINNSYTNNEMGMNILNPYDVTGTIDGVNDFCLFIGDSNYTPGLCLSPAEMNSHVSAIKYLANFNKPTGKEIINYNVVFDFPTCLGCSTVFHKLTFTSGTKTCYIPTN